MPLTPEEKSRIVDQVTEILKASDKKERIEALRQRVMEGSPDARDNIDDAIYSVVQAIEELYG